MKIKKSSVLKWAGLMLVVFLSLATNYLLKNVDRFYVKTEQLLTDPKFLEGLKHWTDSGSEIVSFSGDEMSIVTNEGASHSVSQNVAVGTPVFVRFSFDAKGSNIVGGEEEWARATGTLIYRDKEGRRVGSKSIASIDGSSVVRSYSHIILLHKELGSVDVSFRLLQSGGSFSVRNPVLSLLDEFPFYTNLKLAIVLVWVIVFASIAYIAMRLMTRLQIVAVLLLGIGVLVGALIPSVLISTINEKIAAVTPGFVLEAVRYLLATVFGLENLSNPGAEVSKLGHFLAFVMVGAVVGWSHCAIGLFFGIACVAVFALLTESLQVLVNERTPGISDLAIDVSGGLLGIAIGVGLFMLAGLFERVKTSSVAETDHNQEDKELRDV